MSTQSVIETLERSKRYGWVDMLAIGIDANGKISMMPTEELTMEDGIAMLGAAMEAFEAIINSLHQPAPPGATIN